MNLKTIEDKGKNVNIKTTKNQIFEYRQERNVAMLLLVRLHTPELKIDLADLI